MCQEASRGRPGTSRGILGVSWELPGHARGAIWTPEGTPWEPFGLHFGCLFCPFFFSEFRGAFLNSFGMHYGSILAPFLDLKSTLEALGR